MKFARIVFYLEIVLNFVSATLAFAAPASYVALFTDQTIAPVPLEVVRGYGVLLYVFVWVMFRALRQPDENALSFVVEGFLIGDLLELVALVIFSHTAGDYSKLIGTALITVLLAVVRIYWLIGHYRRKPVTA